MSNNTELKVTENSNDWNNLIKEAIAKYQIKFYKYRRFKNFQEIGSGDCGKVYLANLKKTQRYLVLKSFFNLDNTTVKEIVYEVIIIYLTIYFRL
jgi:hypothetical protein